MDAIDALVGNHALFTEHFVVAPERAIPDVPEIALLRSVLERGIEDLFYTSKVDPGTAAKIRRDAKKWILANDYEDAVSFVTICDVFNLDIRHLRNRLLDMMSKGEFLVIERED